MSQSFFIDPKMKDRMRSFSGGLVWSDPGSPRVSVCKGTMYFEGQAFANILSIGFDFLSYADIYTTETERAVWDELKTDEEKKNFAFTQLFSVLTPDVFLAMLRSVKDRAARDAKSEFRAEIRKLLFCD